MSITLYTAAHFRGRELDLTESVPNLRAVGGFNDVVSSVEVKVGQWKLWEHFDYKGRSYVVGPGKYNIAQIRQNIGNDVISSVQLLPPITLYTAAHFRGRELDLTESVPNLRAVDGFNDVVSSVEVKVGQWKLWEHFDYKGRSYVVGPGKYDIAQIRQNIGNDVISSVQLLPPKSITLYTAAHFRGRELNLTESVPNLRAVDGFNDVVSSVEVEVGQWKLWEHTNYKGRSYVVGPGKYNIAQIRQNIGNDVISSVQLLPKSITLYAAAHFRGRELDLTESVPNLRAVDGFNDVVSSVEVEVGQWKLWEHFDYKGRSYVVGPGKYDIAQIRQNIGNDVISSVQLLSS